MLSAIEVHSNRPIGRLAIIVVGTTEFGRIMASSLGMQMDHTAAKARMPSAQAIQLWSTVASAQQSGSRRTWGALVDARGDQLVFLARL